MRGYHQPCLRVICRPVLADNVDLLVLLYYEVQIIRPAAVACTTRIGGLYSYEVYKYSVEQATVVVFVHNR